jgi:glycosyltransferase involved in cell wall biosynthesis
MEEEILFSIILPTYNRAHLLNKAISSVTNQTYSNWELVIIDDGSTDNTKEVILAIIEQGKRVKYYYQNNAERSAARNNGISKATGNYICFLDSDDAFLSNHLQVLADSISEKKLPEAMFITGVIRNENGVEKNVEYESAESHENAVCYFLMAQESVIPSRVAIHKNVLSNLKFDTGLKDVEDTDLWIQIGLKYAIYNIPVATVIYFLHDDNSTNKKKNPFINQLKGLEKIFSNKELSSIIPSTIRRKKFSSCYRGIAAYYDWTNHYFKMVYYLFLSILAYPRSPATKEKLYLMIVKIPSIFK